MTEEKAAKEQDQESHLVTFFIGFFSSSFIILFSMFAVLAHINGIFTSARDYLQSVYPVFSMFSLLSLHLFVYGCNIFMWKGTNIDHNFIFEFQPSTALKYRDVFLICTFMMTVVVGTMVLQLILVSDGFPVLSYPVYVIPVFLFLTSIILLICPFDIFYRPTRYCFLRAIRNVLCSPFRKVLPSDPLGPANQIMSHLNILNPYVQVLMVDFFMADQLTSQIPLLRHMETTICYIIAAVSEEDQYKTCTSSQLCRELSYLISFAPFYWRAMQCARRWFDERDVYHLANIGKYVSAMVAAWARIAYARQQSTLWMIIVILTSVVASVYQLYWDFVEDWGLCDSKAQNPMLRNDLLLKNESVYYMAIALNLVLRIAWVESVLQFNVGLFGSKLLDFVFASLEVIRRGNWNYFRLENEHLKNTKEFRGAKNFPLPCTNQQPNLNRWTGQENHPYRCTGWQGNLYHYTGSSAAIPQVMVIMNNSDILF